MRTTTAEPPASYFLARRLFLSGIGAVYAVAFASLAVQVRALFGAQGIVPLGARLAELAAQLPWSQRWQVPSLFWLGASDALLVGTCAAGLALAALVVLGLVPRVALALSWLAYLSFVAVGSPFLDFQWDALLLEAGFLAIFLAPSGLRPFAGAQRAPSSALLWLVRWLLVRLMLLSGVVKLTSGDPCWWDLSALRYHYWTQPLPHRLSPFAHELPAWFGELSVGVMFAIELGAPLLVFGPRRAKQVAAAAIGLLMGLISATGNYGFFNLLTVVLCLPLLDDRFLCGLLRRPAVVVAPEPRPARWRRSARGVFAGLVLFLTTGVAWLGLGLALRGPAARACELVAPLRSFNAYGLFRVMTRERPEIVIEGSRDGQVWIPYRFRDKPGELARAPVFAGLHMPRLDWQLWFAALEHDRPRRSAWYPRFLECVLRGSGPVLGLLGEDPFPEAPPRYLRSTVYLYEFSSPAERRAGVWWRRRDPRPFFPTLTLEEGELRTVR